MAVPGHRLEQRSELLAQRMKQRGDTAVKMLRAPGDRTLFTEALPKGEAIEWWRRHRNDKYGKEVIDTWFAQDPAQAMLTLSELDQTLAGVIEQERLSGGVAIEDDEGQLI